MCLGRTVRPGDGVNWGFIEVLYQFGLDKGRLFGAGKPQWTFLHGWLLQVEVSREAGGTQEMPNHSCCPSAIPAPRAGEVPPHFCWLGETSPWPLASSADAD